MCPARTLFLPLTMLLSVVASAQTTAPVRYAVPDPHATAEWALVAPHLPNPLTANATQLETVGDVLRARRFPDDALMYYKASVTRGGNVNRLLKKEGVVHLELQHGLMARLCFQQAVKLDKKDGEAWNNMGAADFMQGNAHDAVKEYKRAVKLMPRSAIFHSNLSLGYFELHDTRSARRELAKAVELDPEIMHRGGTGGYNLQILASSHYAEICFEMARVSAGQGDDETAISWLTKAADRGMNVRSALKSDPLLSRYLDNERVKVMLANADQVHSHDMNAKVRPPSLGEMNERR